MKKSIFFIIVVFSLLSVGLLDQSVGYAQENDACPNLLLNGNMENDGGWLLTSGSLSGQYVPIAASGDQGLLLGPTEDNANGTMPTLSTAWQAITLPSNATTLSFAYWARTGDLDGADRQFAGLLRPNGELILPFLDILQDNDGWETFTADVSAYAGQTFWVYFHVENDGAGNATQLLIDDVLLCGSANSPTDPEPPETATADPVEPSLAVSPEGSGAYSFTELGFDELILGGPFDSGTYRLGLPANWSLIDGTRVNLHMTMLGSSFGNSAENSNAPSTLNILFNDVLLETLAVQYGDEIEVSLPIPVQALEAQRPGKRHQLDLLLDSSNSCGEEETMSLLVHTDSSFTLPFEPKTPITDLRLFPRPIFQDNFLPESAILIVPDQPSPADLQAAFTIAAGLGQITKGELQLSLVTEVGLTPELRDKHSLLFVGLPNSLSTLEQIEWPVPASGGAFDTAEAQDDDGVLQIAVSPWNEGLGALMVSGNSDTGLRKAAQALSQGVIQVGNRTDFALVASVDPYSPPTLATTTDRSLADLGYADQELEGRGNKTIEYEFKMPSGYIAGDDAYFQLSYSHSSLLKIEESGLVVRLNDRAIGSALFDTAVGEAKQARIPLPRSVLHAGVNHLSIHSELIPYSECINPNFGGVWFTVWDESRLSLPLLPISGEVRPSLDLGDFPVPFDHETTLQDVTFVVSEQDPNSWNTAVQIAASLGDKSNAPLVLLESVFANQLTPELVENRHLIIIGQPASLPILSELEDVMPAPFSPGNNFPDEQFLPVKYRLPADTSVGYLELFSSPWSEGHAILTVLGSTELGVQWAGSALTLSTLRGQLSNNLAVIQENQVVVGENFVPDISLESTAIQQTDVSTTLVTTTTPAQSTITDPIVIQDASSPDQPGWIMPALIGSTGLMILIIVIVIGSTYLQYRKRQS